MRALLKQTINLLLFFLWAGIFFYVFFIQDERTLPETIIPILALLFLVLFLSRGTSKLSALTGKILIFAGLFATISILIKEGLNILNTAGLVATLGLATGIYLERVNPRHRLKTWMFLMLATKVQLMIVTALVSVGRDLNIQETFAPLETWWILVLLMALSVPLLIFKKKKSYRGAVILTSVLALLLALDLFTNEIKDGLLLSLLLIAFFWPMITVRMIGRKVFLYP